ncbi:hypothetical protein Hanom_Chr08g00700971 [Helianthus anomalus]
MQFYVVALLLTLLTSSQVSDFYSAEKLTGLLMDCSLWYLASFSGESVRW